MFHFDRLSNETTITADPLSGLPVQRLTNGIGHSHGLYFTTDCWTRDGEHLICASERAAHGNQLYAYHIASGDLLRLTDLRGHDDIPHIFNYVALSPKRDELVLWHTNRLLLLDLSTGQQTTIAECPDGWRPHGLSVCADGDTILTSMSEDLSARFGARDGTNMAAELEYHAAKPRSRVVAIPRSGGQPSVLWEEAYPITHVNASPTDPDLMVFCHEGPWLHIDQRIWGLRRSGGDPWPVRPREAEWGVGHEYWHADGVTVGYHARFHEGTWRHAAGWVRVDNSETWQAELPVPTHHAVGLGRDRIILDSTREAGEHVIICDRDGDGWGPARVLCSHFASRHHSRAHVHQRMRRDGGQVLFTSDRRTYSDVYLVDIPDDCSQLPEWPGKPFRYYWQ